MPNGVPPVPDPLIKAAMAELLTVLMLLRHVRAHGESHTALAVKLDTEAHRLAAIILGGLP